MIKYNYKNIVRNPVVLDMADLIAIRKYNTGEYTIKKCRGMQLVNSVVSEEVFKKDILPNFHSPLVLVDYYLDTED